MQFNILKKSFFDAIHVSTKIFKTVIPILIFLKVVTELGLIQYLSLPFEPLMYILGLPAEYALPFLTGVLTGVTGGVVTFVSLVPELGIPTIAQASTYALTILIAHSLILEPKIAQQCGVSFWSQFLLRSFIAICAGATLHMFYSITSLHQDPANILLQVPATTTWQAWVMNELQNLFSIFCIIWVILLGHALLVKWHVIQFLERLLTPFLRIFGISPNAASVVLIGGLVGILYGSGLLIQQAQEGNMTKKDLFLSVSLMGIAHAIIEDTLLMMLVGASLWIILVYRLIILFIAGLIIKYYYEHFVEKARDITATK